MDSLAALRSVTHRVRVPFGVYNLRPVTSSTRPGHGAYRSSLLWGATPANLRELQKLGLALVVDMRTEKVAENFPDPEVPGAQHLLVDVHGTGDSTPGMRITRHDTVAAMKARYRRMVSDQGQRERIAQVLRLVAETDGAVLFHCTDGKDRTGWVALLLQHVHGDSMAQVRADYLASQPKVAAMARARYAADLARGGKQLAERNQPLNIVDWAYMEAALDEVAQRYGDLDGYLHQGLGLSDDDLARLRERI